MMGTAKRREISTMSTKEGVEVTTNWDITTNFTTKINMIRSNIT